MANLIKKYASGTPKPFAVPVKKTVKDEKEAASLITASLDKKAVALKTKDGFVVRYRHWFDDKASAEAFVAASEERKALKASIANVKSELQKIADVISPRNKDLAEKTIAAMTKMTTPKPLTQQQLAARQKAATKFWMLLQKMGVTDQLESLYFRWQDEKQYEDIKGYEAAVVAFCKKKKVNGKIIKFTSVPFGPIFSLGQVAGDELQVRVSLNSREAKMVFGRRLK